MGTDNLQAPQHVRLHRLLQVEGLVVVAAVVIAGAEVVVAVVAAVLVVEEDKIRQMLQTGIIGINGRVDQP